MIGMFARVGEVETRYKVAEFDVRFALNILNHFEGVNGIKNGFSRPAQYRCFHRLSDYVCSFTHCQYFA